MRATLALLCLTLAACDGASMSLGDPQIRVTSGDGQTHLAAEADSLDAPVMAQLYRTPEGGITFRLVSPLYAQTNVVGVAGEQVCAVGVDPLPLQAWSPCDVTGDDGTASFYFEPGTKAGESCAEIRAVIENQKTITDTVCATVEPGAVAWAAGNMERIPDVPYDDPFGAGIGGFGTLFKDAFGNPVPYTLTADGAFRVITCTDCGPETLYFVDPVDGAGPGDTGTVTFMRDTETLRVMVLTLREGSDANHWQADVTSQTS